jgi:hypothetical protein
VVVWMKKMGTLLQKAVFHLFLDLSLNKDHLKLLITPVSLVIMFL